MIGRARFQHSLGVVTGAVVIALAGLMECFAPPAEATTRAVTPRHTCIASSSPDGRQVRALERVCEYLEGRDGVVQVALFDAKTGRSYSASTGNSSQFTASIVKVDILAEWLYGFQERGVAIPQQIPYSVRYLMERMIENSDNAAATALFYFGGGCDALSRFNRLLPLPATTVACESHIYYGWGNTRTTAADQVTLMKAFAFGKPSILGRAARRYGLALMQNVEPDQRWGISCGPWGTSCNAPNYAQPVTGVTVAVKNGWKPVPTCLRAAEWCPWQVNSIGWVQGQGRDYVLAVLTTDDPVGTGNLYGFNYGVETIQHVSARLWDALRRSSA